MDLKELRKELEQDGEIIVFRFEEMADTNGNKIFLYYGEEDRHFTYKEFNESGNRVANRLLSLGVNKGDRISLFLKNPLITLISMLGIWKAGAIFCPINFNYKGKLLSYQLNDVQSRFLIIDCGMIPLVNAIKDDIPALTVFVHRPGKSDHDYDVSVEENELDKKFTEFSFADLLKAQGSNPGIDIRYYDTANIIYTSGTTGPAKGVVQSYRWMNQYTFGRKLIAPQDVIYNDLPLYHVGGAFANVIKGAWMGCTVELWDRFSPADFWRRITVSGASSAILLDVMIPWLMSADPCPADRLNSLNKVYMQPLPKYHHEVAKRFGIDYVLCGYGQTEAGNGFVGIIDELEEGEGTPAELYKGFSRGEVFAIAEKYGFPVVSGKKDIKKGFMGQSKLLLEATVLNEHDEECSPGELGQLAFRPKFPHSILTGYFGKPEDTLRAFSNQWFHTGDIVYRDEEDNFYFVDRMGGIIRRRGEKFSSYEVEDLIKAHPAVSMCAALPIPAEEGDEDDIVVYIVPKSGCEIKEEEFTHWLASELPKFMRPKYVRFADDLPRTPTNKIEKYKLRENILTELGMR